MVLLCFSELKKLQEFNKILRKIFLPVVCRLFKQFFKQFLFKLFKHCLIKIVQPKLFKQKLYSEGHKSSAITKAFCFVRREFVFDSHARRQFPSIHQRKHLRFLHNSFRSPFNLPRMNLSQFVKFHLITEAVDICFLI